MSRIDYKILRAVVVELNPRADAWLTDAQTDLFEVGALDSVTIMELVIELEKRFNFTFNYTDLRASHFRNLESLEKLFKETYQL